ncbi:MAG: bifunctional demethylmenaquinone methyltransferase/2-methoxy-6-polyprenyl-1,4-benzoquinol methylase UbiE [Alphaproteobacteria bacterium]|nr:bifunctional demethylmenaquinone methyltransferase/2-methoxy-6-polyprenyl-1,4-benzoquinol methylase UbiE [Alphaproteobacteria bacterium]
MTDKNTNPEREWFGEEKVTPTEKTRKVLGVFDNVASKYDVMNDLMSAGVHRLWKDRLIRRIRPKRNQEFLDVAGGTGDIAFRIRKATSATTNITVCDINSSMLEVGRDRAIDRGYLHNFDFITGNAEDLPFEDNSFDVYTIAFGLRNVTHIDKALAEACRVLKPGGRFFCLEFSHIDDPAMSKLYDLYSYNVIPKIGKIVAGDEGSYKYLVESIRKFPKPAALEKRMHEAGFGKTHSLPMSLGIVCIHEGWKT